MSVLLYTEYDSTLSGSTAVLCMGRLRNTDGAQPYSINHTKFGVHIVNFRFCLSFSR